MSKLMKPLGTDAHIFLDDRISSENLGKIVVDVNTWPMSKPSEIRRLIKWLERAEKCLKKLNQKRDLK